MHILFLSHYFPPEGNAPASRTYEHCVRWVKAGHKVTVITCAPNVPNGIVYDGYKNRVRTQVEDVDGIEVRRVWTYVAPNSGTMRRIANYVSYMLSATLASIRVRRPDVIVATSPQFFCGWGGVLVKWLKRRPFVLEVRDIWPESISAVGAISNRWLLAILERMERRMYRAADHVVAVGQGYLDNIQSKVNVKDHADVITNGVDLEVFYPRSADRQLLRDWGVEGKFVCSYVGTIGMAHGLEVVIEAARMLKSKGRDDIAFCLVGDGAYRERLADAAREAGVEGIVKFTGRLPKDQMPVVLASSDACLIHLKPCDLFQTVIPSKMFEAMAMARPIIMGVGGEARDIVRRAGAGVAMTPGCADQLVDAVAQMADDPDTCQRLGAAGREFVARHYQRDALAARYLKLLEQFER